MKLILGTVRIKTPVCRHYFAMPTLNHHDMILSKKLIKNRWLYANLNGILIGIAIALVINFFTVAFSDQPVGFKELLISMMFSVLISLSISNIICFNEYLLSKTFKRLWVAIIGYYGASLIGMTVGHELSHFILSRVLNYEYKIGSHFSDLLYSLTITVIVCTILFAYETQKGRYDQKLQQQELEVLKLKQLKTQAELQILQSKINPHFLYNALNSIASLIHQDADKAEDMTIKLSRLFRYSINAPQDNFATVQDELEIVNTYLDIEKVRFGDRIEFVVYADEHLLKEQIPRFLIQPLVENSLKHGLSNMAKYGRLEVNISLLNGKIILKVIDNGTHFPEELISGYGLQSTYDKLSLLYQDRYEIQLNNLPIKHICISMPLKA